MPSNQNRKPVRKKCPDKAQRTEREGPARGPLRTRAGGRVSHTEPLGVLWRSMDSTQKRGAGPVKVGGGLRGFPGVPCAPGPLPSLSPSCSCWLPMSEDWLSTTSDIRAELSAFPATRLIPGRLSSCTCRGWGDQDESEAPTGVPCTVHPEHKHPGVAAGRGALQG